MKNCKNCDNLCPKDDECLKIAGVITIYDVESPYCTTVEVHSICIDDPENFVCSNWESRES